MARKKLLALMCAVVLALGLGIPAMGHAADGDGDCTTTIDLGALGHVTVSLLCAEAEAPQCKNRILELPDNPLLRLTVELC